MAGIVSLRQPAAEQGPPALSAAERPNTVAGLLAKRKELLAIRRGLERDLHKVTCDLDHLDAAIRLFDPGTTRAAVQRYATKHRAKKGTLRRFVLAILREARQPFSPGS